MNIDHSIIENRLLKEINEIQNIPFLNTDEFLHYRSVLSKIKSNLIDKEFRITVVGEFSSGKSTFLNCLIGKDLLPKGAIETTATITYIHNVKANHKNCDKAFVHYNDTNKSNKEISLTDNINALKDFVSTMSTQIDVAKEVHSVHLYTTFDGLDENVVLIDTPGSNGMASGHKELAIKEIRNAHASLCLFSLKGLGNSDLTYVKEIGQYQKSMFYVMNFIDDLKLYEGDSVESKLKELKALINEYVYEGKYRNTKVFGISALNALESYDTTKSIEEREQLFANSKIKYLQNELFSYVNNGERIGDFYNSLTDKLQILIKALSNLLEDNKAVLETKININDVDLIKKKQFQFNSKIEDNKKKIITRISAKQGALETQTVKLIKDELDKIGKDINAEFDSQSLDNILNKNFNLKELVRKKIHFLHQILAVFLKDHFIDINSNTINYIQEYIPLIKAKNGDKFEFKILDAKPNLSNLDLDSNIQKLEKELKKVNTGLNQKVNENNSFQNLLDTNKKQLGAAKVEQSTANIINKAIYDRQVINLGPKPQPLDYKVIVAKDKTSVLGRLFQPVFGKKDVEEIRYSNQNVTVWIKSKNELERKFQNQKEESRKIITAFENAQKELEVKLDDSTDQKSDLEKKKHKLENDLQSEKKNQDFFKLKARNEFERAQKKQIIENIFDYLMSPNGVVYNELRELSKLNISANIKHILDLNMKDYDKKVIEYKKKLDAVLEKNYGDEVFLQIQNVNNQLTILQRHKLNLEKLRD